MFNFEKFLPGIGNNKRYSPNREGSKSQPVNIPVVFVEDEPARSSSWKKGERLRKEKEHSDKKGSRKNSEDDDYEIPAESADETDGAIKEVVDVTDDLVIEKPEAEIQQELQPQLEPERKSLGAAARIEKRACSNVTLNVSLETEGENAQEKIADSDFDALRNEIAERIERERNNIKLGGENAMFSGEEFERKEKIMQDFSMEVAVIFGRYERGERTSELLKSFQEKLTESEKLRDKLYAEPSAKSQKPEEKKTQEIKNEKSKLENRLAYAKSVYDVNVEEINKVTFGGEKKLKSEGYYLSRFDTTVNKNNKWRLRPNELAALDAKVNEFKEEIIKIRKAKEEEIKQAQQQNAAEQEKEAQKIIPVETRPEAETKEKKHEHEEEWKNSFEEAIGKIKEVSVSEFEEIERNNKVDRIYEGSVAIALQKFIDRDEDHDFAHVVEKKQRAGWLRLAQKINSGQVTVVYNAKRKETYIVGEPKSEESSLEVKKEKQLDNVELDAEKKEKDAKIEAMEEKLIQAIQAIQEIPAVDLRKSAKEGRIFSKSDIKGEMETLLNKSTQSGGDKKYEQDLELLAKTAERILELESHGKKCILLNGITYIIDKKEEISLSNLEKSLEAAIGKKYLEEIELSVGNEIGIILVSLDDNTEWKKLSRLKKEEQIQSGIIRLVNKELAKRKEGMKIEEGLREEISEKLQHYIFSKVLEKQKI